ncbi:MAG: amino acid synthesis family protein [Pontixanthobacter sp.]
MQTEWTTAMAAEIRPTILSIQKISVEGGREVGLPTRLIAAIAIICNPWFGRGWLEDLCPEVRDVCPQSESC